MQFWVLMDCTCGQVQGEPPIVVSTWAFVDAVRAAARIAINHDGSAVDAVVHGCSACEILQCDGSGTYIYIFPSVSYLKHLRDVAVV